MKCVAQARKNRSLADFEKVRSCWCRHAAQCSVLTDTCLLQALTEYRAELRDDPIINTHLAKLYDNLLEQNLIRVIEPFSRVQVRNVRLGNAMLMLMTSSRPEILLLSFQIEHISGLIKLSKVC